MYSVCSGHGMAILIICPIKYTVHFGYSVVESKSRQISLNSGLQNILNINHKAILILFDQLHTFPIPAAEFMRNRKYKQLIRATAHDSRK